MLSLPARFKGRGAAFALTMFAFSRFNRRILHSLGAASECKKQIFYALVGVAMMIVLPGLELVLTLVPA